MTTVETMSTNGQLLGTVLAVQANFYRVQLDVEDKSMRVQGEKEDFSPLPTPYSLLPNFW